ncbi:MAG: response regulator transcription factor [Planctomycetes bacterium]|nr:response regulator transcription factor [Planctomycetota bacterium]
MSETPPLSPVEIWLVEDNELLRQHLHTNMESDERVRKVLSFPCMEHALKALEKEDPPQVLLSDLGLPGMDGAEGIKLFKEKCPDLEALVLTVYDDREKVFEAIQAGASGYLLKDSTLEDIVEGCIKVARGESILDGMIARMMLNTFQKKKNVPSDLRLTPREMDILNGLAKGQYMKEIAYELGIKFTTVNFHCDNLYKKLHVSSQREAITKAKRMGILFGLMLY